MKQIRAALQGTKIKGLLLVASFLSLAGSLLAQQPFIHLIHPYNPVTKTDRATNYISGSTCTGCQLSIDGNAVMVYPTGAFAIQLNLLPGDTDITLRALAPAGTAKTMRLSYHYPPPAPPEPVEDFRIASVETFPSGNCWVMPGDIIRFRVKAQPGNKVTLDNKILLYEQPAAETGVAGIYQCSYVVRASDPLLKKTMLITLTGGTNGHGKSVTYSLGSSFTVLDPSQPVIGRTTGPLPSLEFGLGSDRLGGAKVSYLDTAVLLHITGMEDGAYRVQLAPGHTAYIPQGQVLLLPKGAFIPHSLTGSWRISGDDSCDYISIELQEKLPYTTFQETGPSRIVLNIYGAVSNTNWITQLKSATEVKNVTYEQPSDDVFRVTIELKHHQQWGYQVYYEGTNLVVRIRHQPEKLTLGHLTIAVDAGHGGTNKGAQGPTGVYEKILTLRIASKLRHLLEAAGAKVVMTRTDDTSEDMIERTRMLEKADPDLLVSIHLNSSADPIHVAGTSTYYRYIGFRPLSQAILKHMLALGLPEYGNVGRFNFALNGPTDYPNALVETLFISNPEEEMKALDPVFQEKIARAILAGITDFLKQAAAPEK